MPSQAFPLGTVAWTQDPQDPMQMVLALLSRDAADPRQRVWVTKQNAISGFDIEFQTEDSVIVENPVHIPRDGSSLPEIP